MTASERRAPRWVDAAFLALVVLVAAVLRLSGVDFGLPAPLHPDEPGVFLRAQALWQDGVLGADMWKYPPLMAELVALQLGGAEGLGLCERPCPGPEVLGMARLLSVTFGVVAVALVYAVARTAGLAPWCAALGAGLLACCPLHVQSSRYVRPDVMASAFVALTLWPCARLVNPDGAGTSRALRDYAVAAIGIGLAAASKYNAALVFVAVAIAHALRGAGGRARRREHIALAAAAVVSVLVFAATLAPVWSGPEPLLRGLRHEWVHYQTGHGGFATERPLRDALGYLLWFGWSPVAVCVLALGGALASRRAGSSRRLLLALAGYTLVYLALVARQSVFFGRVLIPILPGLALATAAAASALAEAAGARVSARARPLSALVVAALTIVIPARNGVRQALAMARTDTRMVALAWMKESVPRGSFIAVVPGVARSVPVNMGWKYRATRLTGVEELRRRRMTHVVLSVSAYRRYTDYPERFPREARKFDAWYRRLQRDARLVQRFEQPPLPGAGVFGSTSGFLHQPVIEVYSLAPGRRSNPGDE